MCVNCDSEKSTFFQTNKTNKKAKIVFADYKNMLYCSKCKKHTNEACPKKNHDNKYQN